MENLLQEDCDLGIFFFLQDINPKHKRVLKFITTQKSLKNKSANFLKALKTATECNDYILYYI